ncbi:SPFH domain-containing protein [Allorhizocola rhizosphaerae]|uniref:SPFH domain-containing protein n=1 Tax=Allorhizocola rhizosphaerae TaxID=1872709 RepID=UPI000E3BF6B2|nr:SPFH domain-containing protein [Allorhizocola rhizosphaerae]
MADISRRFFLRHLRSTPTSWVRHHVRGQVKREGVGLSFWYRPLTAVLSEVPVDDRELPLLFHARTSDFTDVTVQATVTYRIASPEQASSRLDFSIHPHTGAARARPLDQIASLLAELAQQPALDLLARLPLAEALTAGISPVREAVSAALAADARLTDLGVAVVSARVVAIRPEPELERALQTPTRESVQAEADRATYARRAQAVEQERAIAENELQNKIELARREQQLVEQHGTNTRRQAELDAAAQLATAQGEAERERVLADAKANGVRVIGLAEADKEVARVGAYRDLPPGVLQALTVQRFAGRLPDIQALTITPDVLSQLLAKLAGARTPDE